VPGAPKAAPVVRKQALQAFLVQHQLLGFLIDVARLCAWLFLLVVIFLPLERLFALHPKRMFSRATAVDVGFFFVSGLVPSLLLAVPLSFLAWGAHALVPYKVQMAAANLPFWGRAAAALVVGEIGFYWGHRWTHEIPFLWRFHSVHHSVEDLYFLASSHAHPFDNAFVRLCGFIPLYALGLASPASAAGSLIPLLIIVVSTAWGFFIHSNLRWRLGPLEWVISTPAFHHWHHTIDEHRDHNYAANLPWIDRIFGTHYLPDHWPPAYGIETKLPTSLAGQLLHPFRMTEAVPAPAVETENVAVHT
jgi:sterol desaturase/sphingolipid hydroxylase (fatty acid hydroxylase superfamily)